MSRLDVIDSILGDQRTPAVVSLRADKPELAIQMQNYYDAVFAPAQDSAVELSRDERWLIAIRTASHTRSTSVVDWYAAQARLEGTSEEFLARARDFESPWIGDPRTAAVMRHVDLIVSRPVQSTRSDIVALEDAGLSPGAVVALSQVVAYVSYQLRLIATLRALGEDR